MKKKKLESLRKYCNGFRQYLHFDNHIPLRKSLVEAEHHKTRNYKQSQKHPVKSDFNLTEGCFCPGIGMASHLAPFLPLRIPKTFAAICCLDCLVTRGISHPGFPSTPLPPTAAHLSVTCTQPSTAHDRT